MAVLPTRLNLSQPSTFVSGRPIATQDTTGVGRGLASLGQSVASLGDDLQRQQDTVDISRAEAAKAQGFIDTKNKFSDDGDYSTFTKRAPQDTSEVVNKAADLIRNPQMREKWKIEAGTDAARVNDAIGDKARTLGKQAETVAFDNSLETQRRIYVDPTTSDDEKAKARADIEGSIQTGLTSGLLTPDEADARRKSYIDNANFSRAKLAVDNDPGSIAKTTTVDQTIPATGRALLDTIASTESAGSYNVLNGGEHFSGYADHPRRVGDGGTATAAGRYQFVAGTWDRAKNALGLKDFSPESQDKAAWWLAQADYKSNTGRDLSSDLQSKDPNVVAGVRRALSPTWEGLKSLSDNKFNSDLAAGPVTNPAYFNELSPEEKQVIYQQQDTKFKQQQVEAKGNIETVVQNAPAAMQNTGTYSGVVPTHQQFVDAYGAQEGQQKYDQFTTAMDVGQQVYNFRTMSSDDIQKMVESERPTSSGNDAELETKKYDALSQAANQTLAARKKDPVAYARQAFPSVDQAWNDAAQSGNYQQAMTATTVAQQQLGIKEPKVLPDSVADQAVASFKQPDISDQQRLGAVSGLVFSTSDPKQRQAVFNQLVDAGLPAMTEGAVEAAARGDQGAANRLMQAALVDPSKLPKSGDIKPTDIDSSLYSSVWEPGAIGDASYGVSYGDASSLERAQRGSDLMKKAVQLRVSQGQDLQSAVDGAAKDLFGDMKVYQGSGSVTANLPVPTDTDTSVLTSGLNASKTAFRAALDLQKQRIMGKPASSTMAVENPAGLVEPGNIDLTARPQVKNDDGSVSTVRSISFDEDGKEILVPTVSPDGRILSNDEAIDLYHQTGQHLGIFKDAKAADAYAESLHQQQDKEYVSNGGANAVLSATVQNRMDDIIDNGVFVQAGNGVGLRDPYTGTFVTGANGQPLTLPLDKILAMGTTVQNTGTGEGGIGMRIPGPKLVQPNLVDPTRSVPGVVKMPGGLGQ